MPRDSNLVATCEWQSIDRATGRYQCVHCAGTIRVPAHRKPEYIYAECGNRRHVFVPLDGPGTELHKLLSSLNITPDSSCNCEAMRQRMNQLGPSGCREHREEILAHLRTAYSKTDWPTVFAAALRGTTHLWLVKRINPLPHPLETLMHPIESGLAALLDEAIERAK